MSCVTSAQLIVSAGKEPGALEALTLSKEPLPLRCDPVSGVQLRLRQQYRLVKDSRRSWHVSTAAYAYRLDDATGNELVSWHWHPGSRVDYPHVHMASGQITDRAHLPTGRVSIESVLRLLLTDLGVSPRRANFGDILAEAEQPFIQHRRWHA